MSDLKFTCPNCGQPILVAASEAGRKLACPGCQAPITIPNARPASPETPAAAAGGEVGGADSGSSVTPPDPGPVVGNTIPRPPAPPASTEPRTLPIPPAEGTSSLRLEPAKAPAHPAAVHTTAGLRRLLGPEGDARLESTTPPDPAEEPATVAAPDAASAGQVGSPAAEEAPPPAQIAVLTSDLKRSIVQAARELIADSGRWLPGVDDKGKLTYAARQVKGRWKTLEPGSDEATHHSLMGAVLRELHRRNVAPTATGRTEFLDGDIPGAIRKIVPEGADAGEGHETPKARAARLVSISHAQCLQVLDLLEAEYAARSAAEAEAPVRNETRGASVDELLVRAARDEVMTVTEVLRAVHAELVTLNHRIAELEKAGGGPPPKGPAG